MNCQTRDIFFPPGSRKINWQAFFKAFFTLIFSLASFSAAAQTVQPDSQFDVIGFIDEATLDTACTTGLCGGKIVVNGQSIVVPANLIVILPANALTWSEMFSQAPAGYAPTKTGMALSDSPTPTTTYEAHVIGNQIGGTFTAGLIFISQQTANSGAGFINHIDYTTGEMRVGGKLSFTNGVPTDTQDPANLGTRVRLDDPTGAFGRNMPANPDPRMTLDPENPTVRSKTGFPMCVPRSDPAVAPEDAACPQGNRPKDPTTKKFLTTFEMNAPVVLTATAPTQPMDPRLMAPFEVGDYVTFAGTLVADSGTSGTYPATANTYIAAHTVTGNLGIFTKPGFDPAYVATDVTIIGNGGVIEPGFLEATVRTRFEGFTTDPSRNIELYAMDFTPGAPTGGAVKNRLWGSVGVDQGPPTGAVKGRWRFRPPCSGVTPTARFCVGPVLETTFLPATPEMRAVIQGVAPDTTVRQANGLIAGQYHAPITDFLFAENLPGTLPPPINFELLPYIAQGGYVSSTGKVAGRLFPFPASAAPAPVCNAPVANAGANFSVSSGLAGVVLDGKASTGTAPLTYAWTSATANAPPITQASAADPQATFNAPQVTVPTPFVFTLTVTGCSGQTASATVTVTVNPGTAATPIVAPVPTLPILTSGDLATLTAKLTVPPNNPANISFDWVQTPLPADPTFVHAAGSPTMTVAHVLAKNQVTNDVLQYQVTATNTATKAVSPPVSVGVTYKPAKDILTVVAATYRIGQRRLSLTLTSSVVNSALVLKLAPYLTTGQTTAPFDPTTVGATMTSNTPGTYTLILSGVPEPAPGSSVTVNSSIGGTVTFGVTAR